MPLRPAVFLDRDGTLIEDREYLRDPDGVCLIPTAPEALRRLRDAGYALVVVTNQSGIGRGWMTEEDYRSVTKAFLHALDDVRLDGVYHCPAAPAIDGEEHPERKPSPGMLLRAARDLSLDLSASWAIGDSLRDVEAGQGAGCRGGILVRTGKPIPQNCEWPVVEDILAAVERILKP